MSAGSRNPEQFDPTPELDGLSEWHERLHAETVATQGAEPSIYEQARQHARQTLRSAGYTDAVGLGVAAKYGWLAFARNAVRIIDGATISTDCDDMTRRVWMAEFWNASIHGVTL